MSTDQLDAIGEPLQDTEVVFRILRKASWLNDDGSLDRDAYIRRPEDAYLSFARGAAAPNCQEQLNLHKLKKAYGCHRLSAQEIRLATQQFVAPPNVCEDITKPHHCIVNAPDPETARAEARRMGKVMAEYSHFENDIRCKDGQQR